MLNLLLLDRCLLLDLFDFTEGGDAYTLFDKLFSVLRVFHVRPLQTHVV